VSAGSFARVLELYRNNLAGLGERLDVTLGKSGEIFCDVVLDFSVCLVVAGSASKLNADGILA